MKSTRNGRWFAIGLSLIMLFSVAPAAGIPAQAEDGEQEEYEITWVYRWDEHLPDGQSRTYKTTTVKYGETPQCDPPPLPRQYTDSALNYPGEEKWGFIRWEPAPVPATGPATYEAFFDRIFKFTWLDENGKLIDTAWLNHQDLIPEPPRPKEDTDEYEYTFKWEPEWWGGRNVDKPITYRVKEVIATKKLYPIKWSINGLARTTSLVEYGTVPVYTGDTPSKANTAEYTYTFDGWEPELVKVTGPATYTAKFKAERNSYKIQWVDDDGTVIGDETLEYGQMPAHADLTKPSDAYHTYQFAGWSPEIAAVTGDATYTATYTAAKNTYAIEGADRIAWTKGSGKTVVVTAVQTGGEDRSFTDFESVDIDGVALQQGVDYTVSAGSTVVTLAADALERLSKGDHTLTVKFIGGEVSIGLAIRQESVSPVPATGDESNMLLWLTLLLASVGGLALLAFAIARKRKRSAMKND